MNNTVKSTELKAAILTGALVIGALYLSSRYSFNLFHTLAELFSIVVACGIFMVTWNTRRINANNYLLFLGIAYLSIAGIDLLHTLTYKGMGVFPNIGLNPPIQFWIAARYLEAGSLLAATAFLRRSFSLPLVMSIYAGISVLIVISIFAGAFPSCFEVNQGVTAFKSISEFIISGLLVLSIVLITLKRSEFPQGVWALMVGAMALTIAAEISFSFYKTIFGLFNQLGHYFKIISFYLIYRATIQSSLTRPYEVLFRDLKASQDALQDNEERLKAIYMGIPIPTFTFERRQDDLRLSDLNQAAAALLDQPPESPRGATMDDLFPGRTDIAEMLKTSYLAKSVLFREITLPPSGRGEEVNLAVTFAYVPPDMMLMLCEDISDRKRAEALRDEVESLTRHDLKTPLVPIIGLPRLLKQGENLTDEQRHTLGLLEKAGYRMLDMINLSQGLYQMESGAYKLEPEPVDIIDVLQTIKAEDAALAKAKDLSINIVSAPSVPGLYHPWVVQGDRLLSHTMLGNLIKNALEASHSGGEVKVTCTARDDSLSVAIHNTGLVPKELRGRFFEKFATWGKQGGTGLGTYSARLIARVHGGDIKVVSSSTTGTTVTVTLPR